MNEKDFDLFDFAETLPDPIQESAVQPVKTTTVKRGLSRSELQQAAFAFLHSLHPSAIAENVPTRCSKFRATAAAFWRGTCGKQRFTVTKTALIVMYEDVDNCFADCADRAARIEYIGELQQKKRDMEKSIRRNEPHLAAADDLFSDMRTWDYSSSSNTEYHRLRRKLEKELHSLSRGSRLEQIRQAGVADLCYLAVPHGLIDPELLLPTWGVVEIFDGNPRFELIRQAGMQDNVTPQGRMNLALNIGTAGAKSARFAAGVDSNGTLRRPPRRRSPLK